MLLPIEKYHAVNKMLALMTGNAALIYKALEAHPDSTVKGIVLYIREYHRHIETPTISVVIANMLQKGALVKKTTSEKVAGIRLGSMFYSINKEVKALYDALYEYKEAIQSLATPRSHAICQLLTKTDELSPTDATNSLRDLKPNFLCEVHSVHQDFRVMKNRKILAKRDRTQGVMVYYSLQKPIIETINSLINKL